MKMRRTAHLTLAVASLVLLNILPTSAASVPAYDTDGDGIPDSWEMYGYDADGEGAIDVDYPAMGANPNHKDVFVEMDYMPGELGSDEDLDRIVQSFLTENRVLTCTWMPDLLGAFGTIWAAVTRCRIRGCGIWAIGRVLKPIISTLPVKAFSTI